MTPDSPDLKSARRQRVTSVTNPEGLDRLPPQSIEAEQGILGCVLLSPNDSMLEVVTKFGGNEEVMYDLRHQTILKALFEMYDARVQIDIITLQQKLKDSGLLEQVGGIAYLAGLPEKAPSAANISYYMGIVRDKFVLRQIIRTAKNSVSGVYEATGTVDEFLDQYESEVLAIRREFSTENTMADILEVQSGLESDYNVRFIGGEVAGIKTGFKEIDGVIGAMKEQEMIIFAARPSLGKSSLAMNIAEDVIFNQGESVGVFSLEMSTKQLIHRLACTMARVDNQRYTEAEYPKIIEAHNKIAINRAKLQICDRGGLSIQKISAIARRMVQRNNVKLLIVDYIQLVNSGQKTNSIREDLTKVSNGIKALARELNIPIIAVSQLSRDSDKGDRKPRMSDLRETGSLEQDADIVLLLSRNEEQQSTEVLSMEANIPKHRNGATGVANLQFFKKWTRFVDAAKVSDEDVPQ
jgi:replicative DNA helicase